MRINEISDDDKNLGTYVAAKFDNETIEFLKKIQVRYDIPNPVPEEDFHTTIVYSRKEIDWTAESNIDEVAKAKQWNVWDTRNGAKCLVLEIESDYLKKRFDYSQEIGATYDFPEYKAHITFSYDVGKDFEVDNLTVPNRDLIIDHEFVEVMDLDEKDNR